MSERRIVTNPEIRKAENEEEMIIEGKAVAFESPETYNGETEIIDAHALDECDMSDVVLRYNHEDSHYTLARTRNGSLELELKEDGLYFKAKLIPTSTNKDAYLMVQNGLLDRCSFAFSVDEVDYDDKDKICRIMKIGRMFDVALVDFPFYNDTFALARNREQTTKLVNDIKRKKLLDKLAREELIKKL